MPNHTTNHLTVTGPKDSIKAMIEAAKGEEDALCCQAIIPMPEDLKGTVKGSGLAHFESIEETHVREQHEAQLMDEYGFDNWYDWCIANWGTKWGVYRQCNQPMCWSKIEGGIYTEFYSAWSPPFPVIAELARRFSDLTFTLDYSDEGGCYAGQNIYQGDSCDENYTEDPVLVKARNEEMGLGVKKILDI